MRSLIDLIHRRPADVRPDEDTGLAAEAAELITEVAEPAPDAAERAADVTEPAKGDAETPRAVSEPSADSAADPVGEPSGETAEAEPAVGDPDDVDDAAERTDGAEPAEGTEPAEKTAEQPPDGPAKTERAGTGSGTDRARLRRLPIVLGVVTVLLGGAAAGFAREADGLRDRSGARDTALTDVAGTSQVKGAVTDDVNAIFSFDYADMARTRRAADRLLTGDAVRQYAAMVAQVRAQAARQKLVLTTTVTDSAVEMLEGRRARLLLFADQRGTRMTTKETTYAAAMLAVDAVRRNGDWKITNIDPLTGHR